MATTTLTDDKSQVAALVVAAQTGDRAAFGELFERFEQHVLTTAMRRLGNFSEAQELCQDVFVQAIEKLHQLRQPECFGGWLRSITTRMAINRMVRRVPMVSTEPEILESTCVERGTPVAAVLTDERETHVRDGLQRLREMDRETLVAFYVKGQTLLEMSDEFDAPLGTIKRRLHVARKRLAEEVDPMVAAI